MSVEKTVSGLIDLFLADISVVAPNIKTNKPRTIKEYKFNLNRDGLPARQTLIPLAKGFGYAEQIVNKA